MTRATQAEALLREAMQKIPVGDDTPECELVSRIAAFLEGEPETSDWVGVYEQTRQQRIDERAQRVGLPSLTDLVLEPLPNGEYAWLRADMTGPRR